MKELSFRDKIAFKTDRIICGPYQVPADKYLQLSDDLKKAKKIAKRRRRTAVAGAWEVSGRAMALSGLESSNMKLFISGTLLSITGHIYQMWQKNRSGGEVSDLLQEAIDKFGPYEASANEALVKNRVSDVEIKALGDLPGADYRADLTSYRQEKLKKFLGVSSMAGVMAAAGDFFPALALLGVGTVAEKVGNKIHKLDLIRSAKKRAGRSAMSRKYLEKTQDGHIRNTNISNAVGHVPEFFAATMLAAGATASNLPTIYAFLKSGIYSDLMGEQRKREEALRSVKITETLINALSKDPFIATPSQWENHVDKAGIELWRRTKPPFANGILIENFVAPSFSKDGTTLKPFNLEVGAGNAAIIQAPSGTGKSVMLMSLMHLLTHEGKVHLVEDGQRHDVHALSGPDEVAEKMFLITKNNFQGTARLVDLLKDYFKEAHKDLYAAHLQTFDPLDVEVAWNTADNILEDEIAKFDPDSNEPSVFHPAMQDALADLRKKRNKWVNDHLSQQKGNLSSRKATQTFGSLSDGERQRMLVEIAYMASKYKGAKVITLDEPLAHLDPDINMPAQIERIRQVQANGAAVLMVAHESVNKLREGLHNCAVVRLERRSAPIIYKK